MRKNERDLERVEESCILPDAIYKKTFIFPGAKALPKSKFFVGLKTSKVILKRENNG